MKKQFSKLALLALVSVSLVSCGKNSSGGDSKSKSKDDNIINVSEFNQNQVSEATLEAVQNAFGNLNMTSNGIKNGDVFYHRNFLTPMDYTTSASFNLSVQTYGCLSFFGIEIAGDCSNPYQNVQNNYYQDIIDSGEHRTVKSISNSEVIYDQMEGVSNSYPTYKAYKFSKNSARYTSMLGLSDGSNSSNTKVSVASVVLSDGRKIQAFTIEKFHSDGKKYIVSPQLPLMANPIAVIDQYGYILKRVGAVGSNKYVQQIQYYIHSMSHDYTGNMIYQPFYRSL